MTERITNTFTSEMFAPVEMDAESGTVVMAKFPIVYEQTRDDKADVFRIRVSWSLPVMRIIGKKHGQ